MSFLAPKVTVTACVVQLIEADHILSILAVPRIPDQKHTSLLVPPTSHASSFTRWLLPSGRESSTVTVGETSRTRVGANVHVASTGMLSQIRSFDNRLCLGDARLTSAERATAPAALGNSS